MVNQLELRNETVADMGAVHALNAAAFETDAEARLVDALRSSGRLAVSLVAVEGGAVVGHIAFSPVTVTAPDGRVFAGIGLGPMAVLPARQRDGIGGRLMAAGLAQVAGAGHRFCVVLGHPEYYPRFGFERASRHGIRWEGDAPEEVFFVRALVPGGLEGVEGVVRYAPEFAGV